MRFTVTFKEKILINGRRDDCRGSFHFFQQERDHFTFSFNLFMFFFICFPPKWFTRRPPANDGVSMRGLEALVGNYVPLVQLLFVTARVHVLSRKPGQCHRIAGNSLLISPPWPVHRTLGLLSNESRFKWLHYNK